MISKEQITRSVQSFFDALASGDVDRTFACYAPGCTVQVVAPGPFEGEMVASKEALEAFFAAIPQIEFEILGVLVDGHCAAVEARSTGKLASGADYANRYHNYFRFDDDGLITAFREYPTYPTG